MRSYRVNTENVLVSAAQDLVQIIGAAGKMGLIDRIYVGASNTTLPTGQQVRIRARILPVTVVNGSGGSTPTVQKTDIGDAASSITALANNTTPATTNGTAVVVGVWAFYLSAGLDFQFPVYSRPPVGPSQSFVLELLSTVSGTVNLTSEVDFFEIGG